MAQRRYTITERDRAAAERYLSRKLETDYWLTDDVSREFAAKREYQESFRDAVALTGWCETWLSRDQWTQLKNAIRAARRRHADLTRDPPKHVTLSYRAWRILHDPAARDGVTLSEMIEERLKEEWMEIKEKV